MTNCYNYLKSNKLVKYSDYPYTGKVGKCTVNPSQGVVGVKDYVALPTNDPTALMQAVQKQPVSVAVASSAGDFYFYKSGVFDSPKCGVAINHAVLLVGYGTDQASGKDYWIIKNSWGAKWGDSGYIKIQKDMNKGPGICGMLKLSSYPIL